MFERLYFDGLSMGVLSISQQDIRLSLNYLRQNL